MVRWTPQGYAAWAAGQNVDLKAGTLTKEGSKDMKIYLGIDPGQTGAMAVIEDIIQESNAEILSTFVIDFEDSNVLQYLQWLKDRGLNCYTKAVLEKVHSMPKQGVSSTCKFCTNFGIWIGRLEALGIPFDFVTPQKWQKVMFDSMTKGDRKAMSLDRDRRLFPKMAEMLKRKKDHNRADALLLAEYVRRMDK